MEKQFTFTYNILQESNLSDIEQKLLSEAIHALSKAYVPYSSFRVGCSVLLENGEVISGANQEVAAYPVCICAEGVALSTASSIHPNVAIKSIFIVAANNGGIINDTIAPCGVCRQRIVEYEDKQGSNIQIYLKSNEQTFVKINSGKDLLPLAFGKTHLTA